MSKLPDVYYITVNNGWGVVKNSDGSYHIAYEEHTMFLEDDLEQEINNVYNAFNSQPKVHKYDSEMLRIIGKNFLNGFSDFGEADEIYTPKVINKIVDCLKVERENVRKLNEAFKPVSSLNETLKPTSSTDIKKEENKMAEEKQKREEVAVNFWRDNIVKKNYNIHGIVCKRVKMPNDDLNDSTPKRGFLIAESKIYEDKKNPKRSYCFLGKDQEYRVTRVNWDPEKKEQTTLEDIKMTGEQISNVFKLERDKAYAAWKASQPVQTTEIDAPVEQEIEKSDGVEM